MKVKAMYILKGKQKFRRCPSFPGYMAGNRGDILGKRRKILRTWNTGSRLCLKVCLYGQSHTVGIAEMILDAWVSPRPSPDHVAIHKDGDHHNNDLSNLKFGLQEEVIQSQWNRGARQSQIPDPTTTQEAIA